MVAPPGLEPGRSKASDFKSLASTDSAMGPLKDLGYTRNRTLCELEKESYLPLWKLTAAGSAPKPRTSSTTSCVAASSRTASVDLKTRLRPKAPAR